MRRNFLLAFVLCVVSIALIFAAGGGCDKKKKYYYPPPKTPGAGGGPIVDTFTFTAVESDTLAPIEGVSVHIDGGNANETKVTDSAGEAVFTGVVGPLDVTYWRNTASKTTLFDFDYAELTLGFPSGGGGGGNGGTISVDLRVVGVNNIDGDALGYAIALSGESTMENEAFAVVGTATSPDPIPIQVATDKPVLISAFVVGITSFIPLEYGVTKYGFVTYEQGVPAGTTEIVLTVYPTGGTEIFNFTGTIDRSALPFTPSTGLATIVADFGLGGIFPFGFGTVDLGLDLYNGFGIKLADRDRYGFAVAVGSVNSGLSGRIIWGDYNSIETIASAGVVLYDVPVITSPLDNAVAVSTTPTVSWNAVQAEAQANFYLVIAKQASPNYKWVGIVDATSPTSATIPAVAALDAGTVVTINLEAVAMQNFDYSSLDPEELLFKATYLGASGIITVTTVP